MVELTIQCFCGETFNYDIEIDSFSEELSKSGIIPLIVPHKDHFVTIYVDREMKVRSVERVILVEQERSPVVVSESLSDEKISEIVNSIEKEADPNKDYYKFVSSLLFQVQMPEALFIAGRIVGYSMWKEWRKPILDLGATYQPKTDLIIKSELKPILDKAGTTKFLEKNTIEIQGCIAPQFVVGLTQGILNAISEASDQKIDIKIGYHIMGESVTLNLKT